MLEPRFPTTAATAEVEDVQVRHEHRDPIVWRMIE